MQGGSKTCYPTVSLSRRDSGILSHFRWLTAANRILCLYVDTADQSEHLLTLVKYIIRFYVPTVGYLVWYQTKIICKDGVKLLWNTINRSRYFSDELKSVLDSVNQWKVYFGHQKSDSSTSLLLISVQQTTLTL